MSSYSRQNFITKPDNICSTTRSTSEGYFHRAASPTVREGNTSREIKAEECINRQ